MVLSMVGLTISRSKAARMFFSRRVEAAMRTNRTWTTPSVLSLVKRLDPFWRGGRLLRTGEVTAAKAQELWAHRSLVHQGVCSEGRVAGRGC